MQFESEDNGSSRSGLAGRIRNRCTNAREEGIGILNKGWVKSLPVSPQ